MVWFYFIYNANLLNRNYIVTIKNPLQFKLVISYIGIGSSFRQVKHIVDLIKQYIHLSKIGSISEGGVAGYAQVIRMGMITHRPIKSENVSSHHLPFVNKPIFRRFIDFSFFERLRSPASSGPLQTPSYLRYRHSDRTVCLPRKPPPLCRRRDVALVKPKQRQRRPFVPSPGPPERLHAVQQRLQQILLDLPSILMLISTHSALLSSRFL